MAYVKVLMLLMKNVKILCLTARILIVYVLNMEQNANFYTWHTIIYFHNPTVNLKCKVK
jgi:hypothetical protein